MILLLDNYDSFTYNLYQFIAGVESEISGIQKDQTNSEVKVIRNDQITPEEILELAPEALVISPGPGKPSDAGICIEAIQYFAGKLPILGICLGHQADERDYGVGAQILREIGIHKMRLLTNNPVKRVGLEAYGLEIVENVPIEITPNKYNERYLHTKKDRMGHTLLFNK